MGQAQGTAVRRRGRLARPDAELYWEVTGEGRAIVFAHGLGGNHASWWQQVAQFATGYACVTFAHRGFSPSSAIVGGPDPGDYADDLAALIDHLGLGEVVIVAQSMGGWTAMEYALQGKAKFGALVLAATTGSIDPARLDAAESWRQRLEEWRQVSEKARAELRRGDIHIACGARMAREQPGLHLLYRHIDEVNAELDKEALRARLLAARTRAPAELGAIVCPTLLLSGDEDIVMPPFAADALAALLPRAAVRHIADAGHSAYFERAQVFNRHLADFLIACGWAPRRP
ncbi:MAG TPA: alpha/beta hydrolase [Hyphomicrobiaceae bacterium]|nr:alpha/beta hydrolase [Hyphomicrobiaceae bacterium]